MIELKFTKDMLALLKKLKGQCLVSCEKEKSVASDNSEYGNIRINFENTSIDLVNQQQITKGFEEELACFSCVKVDATERFVPTVADETEIILTKGKVEKIG